MANSKVRLTILFEDPFWIGLYERQENGYYTVCKITFGTEPKDYEVYAFLMRNFSRLRFSPPVSASVEAEKRISPKRMQRQIQNQLHSAQVGTKAQQALKLQHEEGKEKRHRATKEKQEAEKERQFALRQEKRKEKHKGH